MFGFGAPFGFAQSKRRPQRREVEGPGTEWQRHRSSVLPNRQETAACVLSFEPACLFPVAHAPPAEAPIPTTGNRLGAGVSAWLERDGLARPADVRFVAEGVLGDFFFEVRLASGILASPVDNEGRTA